MIEKAPFPYREHKVEVDPTKDVPAFDTATYEALTSLSYEEIEARAGEFGITPNSGIIPIEVDGQRRYIDTAIDNFGTNARNVVELESSVQSEAFRREVGDTALDGTALETAAAVAEEEEPAEIEVVTADEFVQEVNGAINDFLGRAQETHKSLEANMEALQADRNQMRMLLEEANQYASILLNASQGGNAQAVMEQIAAIQGVTQRIVATLSQQAETQANVVRQSRELDDQSEQTIEDLNASGYRFGAVVTEKMTEAQKDNRVIDKTAADNVFGATQGVVVVLRRLQTAAETGTMDMRRLEDTNEGARQRFTRVGTMCQEILAQAQYGRMDTDEIEGLFRMVYQTAGEYDYEIESAMAKLQSSMDEVASTVRLVEPVHQ